jgi:uncharacterized pyridoxamine 5'-phosphate oxidase family protein
LNNPESNNLTIEKYRHDLEVVRNTAAQIIKDFNLFGIEITFSGNEFSAYEELKKQIIPALKNLYKDNHAAFFSLLYRIDVNEKKVQQVLNNSRDDELPEQLSKLILEREFKKALFKKFYL